MRITFISTVFNEENTIVKLLQSLSMQTKKPDEIIIVDGGSTDQTVLKIKKYKSKIPLKVYVKPGNRSIGRNEAILHAKQGIIVCSDSGNELDKRWVENIIKPFKDKSVDVVAGYYKGKAKNIFQKCVIPYALVMPDQVNPKEFLPATRSIAFTKSIWKRVGGFPEAFSHNEDYVFANKLKASDAKIVFAKDAIVYWIPRDNIKQTFIMLWRFAFGDAEASILRGKVMLLLARYLLGLYFIFLCLFYKSIVGFLFVLFLLIVYVLWAIKKNYQYVRDVKALLFLPVIQFCADFAVMTGTAMGLLKRVGQFNSTNYLMQNKLFFSILIIYVSIELLSLSWGIPNKEHPFPYHMDEWHQLQAVGNTFRYGTPNTAGSANGTMFHYMLSGLYLIPFIVLKIINPFALEINNFIMRERIFEILRLQTIAFGMLTMFVFYKVAELVNIPKRLSIILFTFTPIWLMISGYFKYDIALEFWIILSLYFIFRFAKKPTHTNFILSAIPVSLAFAVKVSAIPLLLIYVSSYFWFKKKKSVSVKTLIQGLLVCLLIILLFGLPDTLFGRGNLYEYFYSNVFTTPKDSSNFVLGSHPLIYLFINQFILLFGHGLYILFIISAIFLLFSLKKNRNLGFIYYSLAVFLISLVPLQTYAGGNRSLVILPFIVLIIAAAWQEIYKKNNLRVFTSVVIILVIVIQIVESYSWVHMRLVPSPQSLTSSWMRSNLDKKSVIGIESIPIYQNLPDIIQKEFYYKQYGLNSNNYFIYKIIDADAKQLPAIVVLTNADAEAALFKISPKKKLLERLTAEGYKKKIEYKPDFTYYNLFNNEKDYFFSWLVAIPQSTTVYSK